MKIPYEVKWEVIITLGFVTAMIITLEIIKLIKG